MRKLINRILFSLLLTAFVTGPMACRSATAADNPHAKWEKEIRAFEATDKTNPPPKDAILFIGSSSIRMWKTLAEDFEGLPVINRGFGGSEMGDLLYFADRIILPYQPRQVIVYAGDNDLAAGKTPEQIMLDFQHFVRRVHHALPKTKIAYISVKPSPSRWALEEKMRKTNQLIPEIVRTDPLLSFIDVFTPMLDAKGKPREELFVADRLHMNRKGYDLWTSLVRPYLSN